MADDPVEVRALGVGDTPTRPELAESIPRELDESAPPALRGALVRGYQRRWEADPSRGAWSGPRQHAAALDDLAAWLARCPDPEVELERVLDGFFGSTDAFVRRARWSLGLLAKDPARYAGTQRGAPGWRAPVKAYQAIDASLDELMANEEAAQ